LANSFIKELKRRNVFRVGIAYLISAWVVAQVTDLVLDGINAPDWVMQAVLLGLGLGLIAALIIAWAYEVTPEGIKKEKDVVRDESITNITAKKLDVITLVAAVAVLGIFGWQQINPVPINPESSELDKFKENSSAKLTTSVKLNNPPVGILRESDSKSIAVLPFTNMANNPESEAITLGLHDDLLTHISKISELKVISRTSVLRYRDTQKSIGEIAQELGVANILEGGVQRAGNQIRINIQLIDAKTDEHLWAEIYDRELTTSNIFRIQSEISEKIAAALKATLSPQEQQNLHTKSTDNIDAYNAYNAGRQRILSRKSSDLKQALALFQRATKLDPDFALAYVGQADTMRLLNEYSDLPRPDMLELGEALVARALSIAPELAEVQTSRAAFLYERGQFAEAETVFKYSLSLNPNYATTYHWYGLMLREYSGRYSEALSLHRKAAELDPLSPVILVNVGWTLFSSGLQKQALAQFYRVLELAPDFSGALTGVSIIKARAGEFEQSIIWARESTAADRGNIDFIANLIRMYLNIGELNTAKKLLSEAKIKVPHHESYIYVESAIDLFSGNDVRALIRVEEALKIQPENSRLKGLYAFVSMLNGRYKIAIEHWTNLSPGKDGKLFGITARNIGDVPGLAWSLKQSGETEQAEQLIAQAFEMINKLPPQNIRWSKIGLMAVQGDSQSAAQAYAVAIKENKIEDWYWIEQMPYFSEVKKRPEYIAARQQLMNKLELQREKLARHDRLENSP